MRSQGIENLRYSEITDTGDKFLPLPTAVEYFALAATLNKRERFTAENFLGDGLVTPDSAFGQRQNPIHSLLIPPENKWLGYELGHNEMLTHPGVYQQLEKWL
jgi:hypothetical protein